MLSRHSVVRVGNMLYLFGGIDELDKCNDLFSFSPGMMIALFIFFAFSKNLFFEFKLQFGLYLQLKWNGERYQQRESNHKLVLEHRQQDLMISSCYSVDTLEKMEIISTISFRSP